MKPTPKLHQGKWTVDLRGWGFGQRCVLGTNPQAPLVDAVYDAFALLIGLQDEARRKGRAQQELFEARSRTVADAAKEFGAEKVCRAAGGREWFEKELRLVVRDLGKTLVSNWQPPEGTRLLRVFRDRCRADREANGLGLSAKTTKSRLAILKALLQREVHEGHLRTLPGFPSALIRDGEAFYQPKFLWIDEPTFRQLRARIYSDPTTFGGLRASLAKQREGTRSVTDADLLDYVARRRLYLSFGFYTGLRTADLDALTESWAYPHDCKYRRHSEKTVAYTRDDWPEMPEPLQRDCLDELARLGRPWRSGELIAGGPWSTAARVASQAGRDVGLSIHVDMRVLRRSFVRQLRLLGYERDDVRVLMGHRADSRLVDQVYDMVPAPQVSVRTRWRIRDEAPATVLPFAREASASGAAPPPPNCQSRDGSKRP